MRLICVYVPACVCLCSKQMITCQVGLIYCTKSFWGDKPVGELLNQQKKRNVKSSQDVLDSFICLVPIFGLPQCELDVPLAK